MLSVKKIWCFISSLLISILAFSQNGLDDLVSKSLCECLTKKTQISENDVVGCLEESMTKYSDLILKEMLKTYGDTTEESGYKFGKETFKKISVSLIYTCDAYYHLMDTIRYTALRNINKQQLRKAIVDMDSLTVKNEDFYIKRGLLFFQLMEVSNAITDFDEALKLNENSYQGLYFKAWGLEIQKKYDQAIQLYDKVAALTQKNEITIISAVARRKKMEP